LHLKSCATIILAVISPAAYDEALAQYCSTVITAFQNVADALRSLQSDAKALTAAVAAQRAAATTLNITQRQLELGQVFGMKRNEMRKSVIRLVTLLTVGALFALGSCSPLTPDGKQNTSTHTGPFRIHHIGAR
jgi:hypothetical protein